MNRNLSSWRVLFAGWGKNSESLLVKWEKFLRGSRNTRYWWDKRDEWNSSNNGFCWVGRQKFHIKKTYFSVKNWGHDGVSLVPFSFMMFRTIKKTKILNFGIGSYRKRTCIKVMSIIFYVLLSFADWYFAVLLLYAEFLITFIWWYGSSKYFLTFKLPKIFLGWRIFMFSIPKYFSMNFKNYFPVDFGKCYYMALLSQS